MAWSQITSAMARSNRVKSLVRHRDRLHKGLLHESLAARVVSGH